jgi:AAA15 family ATPase/GTPase
MPKIISIEIENFQSIKNKTRINFGDITLLYGPNSSGKSAIFDAFELVECVWDPIKFDNEKLIAMLKKWSRIENDEYLPLSLAIEYEFREDGTHPDYDVWEEDINWKCKKPRTAHHSFFYGHDTDDEADYDIFQNGTATVRLEITFNYSKKYLKKHVISHFKIALNDKLILSYGGQYPIRESLGYEVKDNESMTEGDFLAINAGLGFHDPSLPLLVLRKEYVTKDTDLHIKINDDKYFWGYFSINEFDLTSFVSKSQNLDEAVHALIEKNASDLTFYFGTLLGKILRNSSPLVKADRRVPSPKEALTIVDPGIANWWGVSNFSPATPARLIYETNKGIDPHYAIIARSAHAELLKKTVDSDFWRSNFAKEHLTVFFNESDLIDRVNRHLESSLFKEKVYRVRCSSTLMVPIDLKEEDPWDYYSFAQPAAVRLYLEDGESRKTEFEDVGSGIPFVLPVLCAVATGGLIKVQQPELHLHPALQSSLADVFIEDVVSSPNNQLIVETHSEHLLLRLLRRIRDTEKGQPVANELRLSPSNIAIYYFDPQVNGGTTITKQLVTPLGDFYTDWPRGFFAERDGDLFHV